MPKLAARGPGAALHAAAELLGKGRLREARSILLKVLKQDPGSAIALQLAGIVSSELGMHDQAIRYLERVKELAPSSGGAYLNLGKALEAAGRLEEAVVAFESALRLLPDSPDVFIACGGALVQVKRFDKAAKYYREAVRLDPASPNGYYNLSKVLWSLGRYEEALVTWEQVQRREPNSTEPAIHMTGCRQELCDWEAYGARLDALRTALARRRAEHREVLTGATFWSLVHCDDAALQRQCAESEIHPMAPRAPFPARHVRVRDPIRLAYVSADFRRHPVAKLATGLLEAHDRSRFEIIGVALNKDDGSSDYRRSVQAFDTLLDAHDIRSVDTLALMMRERKVDVAVDLMGHTRDARPLLFVRRAAPIQVNFLGFPGTTAIPSMDYIVVDPFIANNELRRAATEKLVIMPDCYQCNDSKRPPIDQAPLRSACGLPENGVVFASFNQQRKITPLVFDVWMRILKRVDQSVLWLLVGPEGSVGATAASNLRREAARRGVAPERIVIASPVSHQEHLARIALADLHLDTFPYTSHTTGSDALWAGCPIITRAGTSFPSRVCGSLLATVGVPELITTNWDDYEALAISLARDRAKLDSLKQRIIHGRATSPLFDTERFCRNLELAYEEMVRISASGARPVEIDVRSLG